MSIKDKLLFEAGIMENKNLLYLQNRALYYAKELSQHKILQKYWNHLSLILKGSVAREYSDKYSDIDFVIFSDQTRKNDIVSEYIKDGLSKREDGIFLPLNDTWEGHYNLDTYENLEAHFTNGDMMAVWEYSNIMIMYDSNNRYSGLIALHTEKLLENIHELIKKKYIEIQLNMDWMRQPLRRADVCASIQYAAHVQRYCCHILFLLSNQGYPPDKWLFYYLKKVNIADHLYMRIINYSKTICGAGLIKPDKELTEYELYAQASEIVNEIIHILKKHYGDCQWMHEWYLYA